MDTLNISQIEQSAAVRLEVAKKAKELASLVDRAFPGYAVYIERRGNDSAKPVIHGASADLSNLPALDQVETVLREARAPMEKRDLFNTIHQRGGTISMNTLSIYLSRYPRFVSHGRGLWGVDPNNHSNGTRDSSDV